MENHGIMAADMLQKSLRELRALGVANDALDDAVRKFEQAKDDKTRRSAGDHLRSMIAQCIETARHELTGERRDQAIATCEALGAHVPADPF